MPPVTWYVGGVNALGMGDKMDPMQSLTRELNLSVPEEPPITSNKQSKCTSKMKIGEHCFMKWMQKLEDLIKGMLAVVICDL